MPHGYGPVAAWVVPSFVFFAWQALLWFRLGHIPLLGDAHYNAGAPFTGLWQSLLVHFRSPTAPQSLFWFGQAGVLCAVWVWALLSLVTRADTSGTAEGPPAATALTDPQVSSGGSLVGMAVPLAFVGNVVLGLSLPSIIWVHALADLRPLADSFVFAAIVLLSSRMRWTTIRWPAAATALGWIVVAAYRVTSL